MVGRASNPLFGPTHADALFSGGREPPRGTYESICYSRGMCFGSNGQSGIAQKHSLNRGCCLQYRDVCRPHHPVRGFVL